MFDFMYFNGFIWLFRIGTITIIVIIQAENLNSMLISQHHSNIGWKCQYGFIIQIYDSIVVVLVTALYSNPALIGSSFSTTGPSDGVDESITAMLEDAV